MKRKKNATLICITFQTINYGSRYLNYQKSRFKVNIIGFIVPNSFICFVHRLALAIPKDSSLNSYSKCQMYAVNYTQILTDGIKVADPNWPTEPCRHGWEFLYTDVPYTTIATEVRYRVPSILWSTYVPALQRHFNNTAQKKM